MPMGRSVFPLAVRTRCAWLLSAVLLLCGAAGAQEYSLRTFVSADGLADLSVQKIFQDRDGFLWVSTENGLFRYDGDRFQAFGPEQGIPAVAGVAFGEAPDGALLVGGSVGLFRLRANRFEKLSAPFKTVSWAQGIQSDGRGHTYLTTDAGLYVMEMAPGQSAPSFRRVYPQEGAPEEPVSGVFVEDKAVWFGCGVRLCALQSDGLRVFDEKDGLPGVPLAAVVRDGAGNLWVRARNSGVFEWPKDEAKFRRPNTPVSGAVITGTPALDEEGRILLGTPDGLLIGDGNNWETIDRRVGLRGGVFAAFEDRQHSLWIGTGGRGLIEWRGYRAWESYSSNSGLPSDNVYEMLPQGDGSVWVGTEAGLVRGQPRASGMDWKLVPRLSGIPVHSLQTDAAGDLWVGTVGSGVARYQPRSGAVTWFAERQGLTGKRVFTIRFDRQQRLWAATDAGVFLATAPYELFARIADLPSTWFWMVVEGADGAIWAGGDSGLYGLIGGQWHHWDKADGLSNQAVSALGPDPEGSIWVGYTHGGGIDRVALAPSGPGSGTSAGGATLYRGVQRPGTDGLIYFLSFDHAGHLWAGTEHGLDEWDGAHWAHYDRSDGLIWDDCDIGGFAAAPDGSLWIGTSGGLSHFKPRTDKKAAVSPAVVFTELRMGRAEILPLRNPSFPASAGALVARFAAPNAVHDSSLAFRYRLEAGAAWTETTQRQLELARLAPGTYELEVQVRDRFGVWSPLTAKFPFVMETPWYRRGWFLALLAFLPLVAVSAVFRLRTIAARIRETRLQEMVDEKTHNLREANEELLRLSTLDPLTGLANRRRFDETMKQECARLTRSDATLSLILIDVDHFKALNDSAGHQKGDQYLVVVARQIAQMARRTNDLAARIGGEEFALILPSTNAAEAARIAELLRMEIEELNLPHPATPGAPLTVSAGVATANAASLWKCEDLVSAADRALYKAKSLGRNLIQVAG
ncbi:diguanylate cyclase [Acidobacteria bacterium AB60]|nr:diguanylate cyclase [Acidobacteria bacterium AB60]